jgi:enoyl-CoA hydratase/carnithine racemase
MSPVTMGGPESPPKPPDTGDDRAASGPQAPAEPNRRLRIESVGDAVVLTFDRPDTHNSIDAALARALVDAVRLAAQDPSVRGIVLTGAGDRTFTSGGDLNMLVQLARSEPRGHAVLDMGDELAVCERVDVPVIAAVQGDAYGGGCELLLLCDLVIVESHAQLAFRHAKMGLSPAWGGLTRLVERVGPTEAARLLYTAEKIDAAEALRIGLVNEVVPKGAARARAIARVARIADNPRTTVAALKRALCEVREARRGAAIERERRIFSERWGAADHQDAMNTFLSKK